MKKHHKNKTSGFTLAELLIVVAIIAVLVAISIPVFTNQLEKSREATDAANIRSQYAEIMAEAITAEEDVNSDGVRVVRLKQTRAEWQNSETKNNLEGLFDAVEPVNGKPESNGIAYVKFEDDKVILVYGHGSNFGNAGESMGFTSYGNTWGNNMTETNGGHENPALPSSYRLSTDKTYKLDANSKYTITIDGATWNSLNEKGEVYQVGVQLYSATTKKGILNSGWVSADGSKTGTGVIANYTYDNNTNSYTFTIETGATDALFAANFKILNNKSQQVQLVNNSTLTESGTVLNNIIENGMYIKKIEE